MSTIGERLKILIDDRGLTPYKVSLKTKISQSTLSRILNKNSIPNESTMKVLIGFFNVSETWLLTGKEFSTRILKEPKPPYSLKSLTEADIYFITQKMKDNFEQLMDDKEFKKEFFFRASEWFNENFTKKRGVEEKSS